MNTPLIMIQTKTVYVVGDLLSFYTNKLNTQLVKVDEPTEIVTHLDNYNPDEGDWYSWKLNDSCCSFQYVTAIRALARVKNLVGSTFEVVTCDGKNIYRKLGIASLGTLDVYDKYKLTVEDTENQEIVFSKISEILNLRMEVDFLKSELETKAKVDPKQILSNLLTFVKKAS